MHFIYVLLYLIKSRAAFSCCVEIYFSFSLTLFHAHTKTKKEQGRSWIGATESDNQLFQLKKKKKKIQVQYESC